MAKDEQELKWTPKAHFEDEITKGVSRGIIRRNNQTMLNILDMKVGFGKTNVAVMTAVGFAMMNNGVAQLATIAPKTKRLDGSFEQAIRSAEKYYNVELKVLPINGEAIGTFSGLSAMLTKPDKLKRKMRETKTAYSTLYANYQALETLITNQKRLQQAQADLDHADKIFKPMFDDFLKLAGDCGLHDQVQKLQDAHATLDVTVDTLYPQMALHLNGTQAAWMSTFMGHKQQYDMRQNAAQIAMTRRMTFASQVVKGYKPIANTKTQLATEQAKLSEQRQYGSESAIDAQLKKVVELDGKLARHEGKFAKTEQGMFFQKLSDMSLSDIEDVRPVEESFEAPESSLTASEQTLRSFGQLMKETAHTDAENAKNEYDAHKNMREDFYERVCSLPTVFIFDETHMALRDPTSTANKELRQVFQKARERNKFVTGIGLTATPTDKAVLDCIGYMVLNGSYKNKTDFYRREVRDFDRLQQQGLTMDDINLRLIDRDYHIHPENFVDYEWLKREIAKVIYVPDAPQNFHIPVNRFHTVPVELSDAGKAELKHVRELDRTKAFKDSTTKRLAYINNMTADSAVINRLIKAIKTDGIVQPLIFYQFNDQRDALVAGLEAAGIHFTEVNGSSKSFFTDETKQVSDPVLIQYRSGAAAFEAKDSNTSLYYGLPDSSVDYEQSLGRNARRGQEMEIIDNYIFEPQENGKPVAQFKQMFKRIQNKMTMNKTFLDEFKNAWGVYESAPKKG